CRRLKNSLSRAKTRDHGSTCANCASSHGLRGCSADPSSSRGINLKKPDFITHFHEGIAHFNNAEFWEAHESWEALWLVAESDVEQFLQGLIQIAAAYHHVKRGTLRGAPRLFEARLRRLAQYPRYFFG